MLGIVFNRFFSFLEVWKDELIAILMNNNLIIVENLEKKQFLIFLLGRFIITFLFLSVLSFNFFSALLKLWFKLNSRDKQTARQSLHCSFFKYLVLQFEWHLAGSYFILSSEYLTWVHWLIWFPARYRRHESSSSPRSSVEPHLRCKTCSNTCQR